MLDETAARDRALDAAAELFYSRGIQTVGMDAVRSASGVSLKRLYQLFPSKDQLVIEFLRQRDSRWQQAVEAHVNARTDPRDRIAAVFDWLYGWFSEPDYRGCAFINSFGELGAISPGVTEQARHHKKVFHDYLTGLVDDAGGSAETAQQVALLAEGAIVTSAIFGKPDVAHLARDAALALMRS
ncbi:TetR/AcrR family transcriptional regulator [Mycolicibacterium sp. HK-90]|uniref:TetR/AcrR family transcriptional regulator n=1 Tax=Mycolicibacterium sp. HK-90 TaxID=3056937 RepID=UPI00265B5CC6|nr:TetR/AcrR family transcriptional regulator [Mycolicibacterium sp. HK-90]WKG03134.1 TetR/AcrR family transcriptional regulator [Mycolicibacterium sp. HK-90]